MKKLFFILCVTIVDAKIHMVSEYSNMNKSIKSWIEIKNENLTRQKHDYSCGSASLSTILKYYYNQDISENEVLNAVMKMKGLTKDSSLAQYKKANGLSFLDLSVFVFSKGFKALGFALDMESLRKIKIPLILYVKIRNSEHFTVFKGIDNEYAYLADPSLGNTKVKISKFKEMFYQREDLKYPGKVLAIFPPVYGIEKNVSFMKIPPKTTLMTKVIRSIVLRK